MAAAKEAPPPKKARKQRVILTADEWQKRLAAEERAAKRAGAKQQTHEAQRAFELSVKDLRDQTVSIVRNTYGDDYEKCHQNGGAHPSTIRSWQNDEVLRPQMPTMRATLLSCGYDINIVPTHRKNR
jgi:hypothetical protein